MLMMMMMMMIIIIIIIIIINIVVLCGLQEFRIHIRRSGAAVVRPSFGVAL